jgi:nitrilase
MKVGCVHASPRMLDRDASIVIAAEWVRAAAAEGVELLAFPEAFVPGFPYWVNLAPSATTTGLFVELYKNAVPTESMEEVLAPLTEACAAGGVSAVVGVNERQGGTVFNALVFIDGTSGAIRLVRRKLMPTGGERAVWGSGDASTLHAARLGDVDVSGLMCFEHTMHLARHTLAVEQAAVHAAAWPGLAGLRGYADLFHEQVDALSRSYAIMAQAFVLSAMNPISQEALDRVFEDVPDTGIIAASDAWSAIFAPSGRIVAEYRGSEERIVSADVDLEERYAAKRLLDANHFGRPECFTLHVDRTPYSQGNVVDTPA